MDSPKPQLSSEERRRRNDLVSKRLGQYLLKGYTMLADVCPNCDTVLMRSNKDNVVMCLGCGIDEEEKAAESADKNSPVKQLPAVASRSTDSANPDDNWTPVVTCPASEERRRKNDLISAKLSEFLLKGFTMLADVCNVCDTVLMRKDGVVVCVGCEENKSNEIKKNGEDSVASPTGVSSSQTSPLVTQSDLSAAISSEAAATTRVLLLKMSEARQRLEATRDLAEAATIIKLISDCSACILSLNKLSS